MWAGHGRCFEGTKARLERENRDGSQAVMTADVMLRVDSQETAKGFASEVWERNLGWGIASGQDLSPWMGKGALRGTGPPPRVSATDCEEKGRESGLSCHPRTKRRAAEGTGGRAEE